MAERPLRVLALAGHPIEVPGARYRVYQFAEPLGRLGIDFDVRPFFVRNEFPVLYTPGQVPAKLRALLHGTARRALTLAGARCYDAVFIHLWVHPVTFPPFDLALRLLGVPIVYDIDDAYYLQIGSVLDRLRDPNWTVRLMRIAHHCIAGSEPVRAFVERHNPSVEILPTAVDTDRFVPRDFETCPNPHPVLGWIGSPSTAPFLDQLFPVLATLARDHDFVFRVVGAGRDIRIPGVAVESVPWTLDDEIEQFRSFDVGLYPLGDHPLSLTKHGFKLNQYRAVGIPAVASALGLNPQLVREGEDAFLASTAEQWRAVLSRLLRDEALRRRVGVAGRAWVEQHVSLRGVAGRLAEVLRTAADAKVHRA